MTVLFIQNCIKGRVLFSRHYFTSSVKGENGKIIGLSEIFQKLESQSEQ